MSLKKKILTKLTAALMITGVGVSSAFSSPADLVNGNAQNPDTKIEMIVDASDQVDEAEQGEDSSDEKKKGFRNFLRQQILKLPLAVRALVGVPLWGIGWALCGAASALWSHVLSPVAGAAAGWVLLGVLLLAAGVLAIKAMFPDVPLRKILIKENIGLVAIGTAVLAALCAALPLFWENFPRYEGLIKFAGGLLILAVLILKVKFGPDSYDRSYSI